MRKYERHLEVVGDGPSAYMLATKAKTRTGVQIYFGGVRAGKTYVSYHFFPIYACPDLLPQVPPELRSRMQGKSCFNFKTIDGDKLRMLKEMTRAGFERFRKEGMLEEMVWDPHA